MKLAALAVAAVTLAYGPAMSAAMSAPKPECGKASWYDKSAGAGEGMSAAHPSLPFGTKVVVENLDNGRTATVEINDRGPFTGGRIIDVSRAAAEQLDFVNIMAYDGTGPWNPNSPGGREARSRATMAASALR